MKTLWNERSIPYHRSAARLLTHLSRAQYPYAQTSNEMQTCQLTRLKWARPAFEYKTRVTRLRLADSNVGADFDTFCLGEAFSSGQNSKIPLISSWWERSSLPLPKTPHCLGLWPRPSALPASGCGPSGRRDFALWMTRLD